MNPEMARIFALFLRFGKTNWRATDNSSGRMSCYTEPEKDQLLLLRQLGSQLPAHPRHRGRSDRIDGKAPLTGHGEGGPNNETAVVSFNFSEKDDAAIEGSGHVTVTSKKFRFPQYCEGQAMPLDPFDVSIGGRRVGDEFQLELGNPILSGTSSGTCRDPNGKITSWSSPWSASLSSPKFGDIGSCPWPHSSQLERFD
jgi:hypothetical protein